MCGRYFFDPDDYRLFLDKSGLSGQFKGGEIVPTAKAPVLRADHSVILCRWGLPFYGSSKELLHARAETLEEKKTFAPAFRHDRLMIPTSGFFEWQHEGGRSLPGQKYFFKEPEEKRLYLAGLLLPGQEGPSFVIITRPAGPSMEGTHDREPLILPRKKVNVWLRDIEGARALVKTPYVPLERSYAGD